MHDISETRLYRRRHFFHQTPSSGHGGLAKDHQEQRQIRSGLLEYGDGVFGYEGQNTNHVIHERRRVVGVSLEDVTVDWAERYGQKCMWAREATVPLGLWFLIFKDAFAASDEKKNCVLRKSNREE